MISSSFLLQQIFINIQLQSIFLFRHNGRNVGGYRSLRWWRTRKTSCTWHLFLAASTALFPLLTHGHMHSPSFFFCQCIPSCLRSLNGELQQKDSSKACADGSSSSLVAVFIESRCSHNIAKISWKPPPTFYCFHTCTVCGLQHSQKVKQLLLKQE